MTEEIKELLRFLSRSDWYKEADQLEDYIKNLQQLYENALKVNQNTEKYRTELETKYVVLQQENERLTSLCVGHEKELRTKDIIIKQIRMEAEDYKSRLEKASNKLDSMFANGEENKILDDLLELDKIVRGEINDSRRIS